MKKVLFVVFVVLCLMGCNKSSGINMSENATNINESNANIKNEEKVSIKNVDEINTIRSKNLENQLTNLEHEKDSATSIVYFTKDISAEGMVKIYDVLNNSIDDDKKLGKNVAVKLSTGEAGNNNYLHPELIGDLVKKVNGTIVECNTAYGGRRSTTEEHMKVAEEHGFTKVTKVDIMDDKGEFEIPVNEKAEILKKDIVGINLKNYDSILCLSHFKSHIMGGFGGAIKNMSIGVASPNGKAYIHTAGKVENVESLWSNVGDQVGFEKAMAEVADSVRNFVNKKVVYINVMNNISIDCDCVSHPTFPDMHDVGILASIDPVALDQVCVDIVYNTDREESQTLIDRIENRQGHIQLEQSEKIGAGSRNYKLIIIND